MNDWKEYKLGDFINVKHGFAFKGEFITPEINENVLVTPGNFYIGGGFKKSKLKYYNGEFPTDYILKEGDVVVTMTDLSQEGDTLGYSAKIPYSINQEKYLHNQRIGLIEFLNEEIDRDFCYWVMRTSNYQGYIVGAASGTSIRHTSPTTIKSYSFLLPPLPTQKAIATILSRLDAKIDLLHRQNQTLEQLAETLFMQKVVEDKKDSWQETSLDKIATYLNGLACQKYPANGLEYLPVIKIKELRTGITSASDKADINIPSNYIVEDGDVLFSWSGSLEVIIWNGGKGALNQHLFKVSSDHYPKWFYYLWTKYHLEDFRSIANDKATTMGHIQRHHLKEAVVFVPNQSKMKKLETIFQPMIDKMISNSQQIKTLTQLRDSLLPQLMSGAVRVK